MHKYEKEGLYIAGPECFYTGGYDLWWAQRKLAEFYGIPVVLPTSTPLKLDSKNLQDNAREIFDDLIVQVNRTTAIITDLEFFRGSEPDGGTIFEMGWIWQNGGRVYGYTRDKRMMAVKNQSAYLKDDIIIDQDGKQLPYSDLPFSPDIMGSSRIIEGDFKDALQMYLLDLEDERRGISVKRNIPSIEKIPNRVYIASPKRYYSDYSVFIEKIKKKYEEYGYEAVFPAYDLDTSDDPLYRAQKTFDSNMELLLSSSVIVADLNNFHGFEPSNDVSFECGVAWGRAMKCIGIMNDTRIMKKRIPHYPEDKGGVDWCGNVVENFNFPINLMFSSYFTIIKGSEEEALKPLAES